MLYQLSYISQIKTRPGKESNLCSMINSHTFCHWTTKTSGEDKKEIDEIRTRNVLTNQFSKLARLPIPPQSLNHSKSYNAEDAQEGTRTLKL
jgi:hypothetical protein